MIFFLSVASPSSTVCVKNFYDLGLPLGRTTAFGNLKKMRNIFRRYSISELPFTAPFLGLDVYRLLFRSDEAERIKRFVCNCILKAPKEIRVYFYARPVNKKIWYRGKKKNQEVNNSGGFTHDRPNDGINSKLDF